MPAPTVTKAAIQRAIEATVAAGLTPSAVEVSRDGTVRVETSTQKKVDEQTPSGQILTPAAWPRAKGV